jgi:uncharacterized protein YggU (UPF0235/DUF167 family)
MAAERPWTVVAGGLVVVVRLTPKGGRDAIDRIERLADGNCVLTARVRAAASDGEANDALVRLLADALDVAPRQVSLLGGATARIKRLMIAGDGMVLAAVLEHLAGDKEVLEAGK